MSPSIHSFLYALRILTAFFLVSRLVFLQGVAGLPSQDLTPPRGLPAASLSGRELQRPSPSHLSQDMYRTWKGLASWENLGKDVGKITRFSVVEEHDNLNQLRCKGMLHMDSYTIKFGNKWFYLPMASEEQLQAPICLVGLES
ncbi:uncharacterized protein [Triticum aestivum]|uniref:uncharacterized protein isoform X2 n=1 Tax=Triticum aestivum TaxID=4565 RepID=UPI001D02E0D0|nr:uncharacterized protein LOC123154205 isoform X2 [Triticum aestivum]